MFEKFFGGSKKGKGSTGEEAPKLDGESAEFNKEATQVGRDTMRAESITKYLIEHIEDLIEHNPSMFFYNMQLAEALEILEEDNQNTEFSKIKQQIEHFMLLYIDKDKPVNTVNDFLEILRKQKIKNEQILHPEIYTHLHDEI